MSFFPIIYYSYIMVSLLLILMIYFMPIIKIIEKLKNPFSKMGNIHILVMIALVLNLCLYNYLVNFYYPELFVKIEGIWSNYQLIFSQWLSWTPFVLYNYLVYDSIQKP